MKIAIVDDEIFALKRLERLLNDEESIEDVCSFLLPMEFLNHVKNEKVDAVFIDYELPGMNGLEIAKEIRNVFPKMSIIFITANHEFGIEAFELKALDYILKPYDKIRLEQAVERLVEHYVKEDVQEVSFAKGILPIFIDSEIIFCNVEKIYYIKSEGRRTLFNTSDGTYLSDKPLRYYEHRILEPPLFKTHKQYIVNLKKVKSMTIAVDGHYIVSYKEINDQTPLNRLKIKELKSLLIE